MPSDASYAFHWLDVFTQQRFGGNPLVVFPDGRGLTDAQMQQIAREFNISETVFLLPPATPTGTRRLRIFTPSRELPFAGHPTIGTAHLLATRVLDPPVSSETTLILEEIVGPVAVAAQPRPDGTLFLQLTAARAPEFRAPRLDVPAIAAALNLSPADFESDLPGGMASCGAPFLIVPLRDTDALGRARLDGASWQRAVDAGAIGGITDRLWTDHVYLIARDETLRARGADLRVRMFAPGLGVTEDPATGAAATALAAHLAAHAIGDRTGTFTWTIEQGIEMGRPSTLYLEAEKRDDQITAARVGGYAVWVGEGRLVIRGGLPNAETAFGPIPRARESTPPDQTRRDRGVPWIGCWSSHGRLGVDRAVCAPQRPPPAMGARVGRNRRPRAGAARRS